MPFRALTIPNQTQQSNGFRPLNVDQPTGKTEGLQEAQKNPLLNPPKVAGVFNKNSFIGKQMSGLDTASNIGRNFVEGVGSKLFGTYKDVIQKIPEDIKDAASDISKGGVGNIAKGVIKATVRPAADAAEAIFAPISSVVGQAMEQTGIQGGIESAAKYIVDKSGITDNKAFQDFAVSHPNAENDFNRALTLIMAKGEKGEIDPARMAKEIKASAGNISDNAINLAQKAYSDFKSKLKANDVKKVNDAVGQITQGKSGDIPRTIKALSSIDTTDIKTYRQGVDALDTRIKTLAEKQDEVLSTNKEQIKLNDWKSKSGHNFVNDALIQLKDFYKKTNNPAEEARINTLIQKAENQGLTFQEVNSLAREHGDRINAFNANGEAASGLTKQAAENTRSGVKDIVRQKFGNDNVYKASDRAMSDLIRTKDLFEKQSEEVNKLGQKIQKRSWGEKAGRLLGHVINMVGLNSPKGLFEYFLSRGTGLKTLNALDLESQLPKNLKIIRDLANRNIPEKTLISEMEQFIKNNPDKPQLLLPAPKPGSPRSAIFSNSTIQLPVPDEKGVSMPQTQVNSEPNKPIIAQPDIGESPNKFKKMMRKKLFSK